MPIINRQMLRSMPFRLALGFTLLYLLCFTIGAFLYYTNLQDRILSQIDQSLVTRHEVAQNLYNAQGVDAVVNMVQAKSDNPMSSNFGIHFAAVSGERLAGNVPSCATDVGWLNVPANELGFENNETYRFYTTQLGDNLLSIGRSVSELDEMREYSLNSFYRTFLITVVLSLIGGTILASRSYTRVRAIVRSMERVARGNLSARLPVSGRCDDIDSLTSNMNNALGLLQQQVIGMRDVSANIAHDLKTPLNRLFIKIEEAASRVEAGEPVHEQLDDAMTEASNINHTFEALLRIAQIEAGARKAQFIQMDLLPTLHTAVEVYEAVAEEHEQTITLEIDGSVNPKEGLYLLGDKDFILQLVVNLIENAIRHCPAGTEIVVGAGVADLTVWISISDNGPGIPEQEREQVFQRLYRLESSRTSKGSGLGLSLVKAVADLHCGKVLLSDNNPGLSVKVMFDDNCPIE